MATKQFNSRIQWKKDTSANWTSNNPVLLNGEIAIVVTNSGETRFKIGDGTSSYTALPFQDEAVRALITAADDKIDAHITDTGNPHAVTKSQVGLGNVDNVKQYSASNPPPYPVTSVNTKTGDIVLTAEDVNALPITGGTISGDLIVKNPEGSQRVQLFTDYLGTIPVAFMNSLYSEIFASFLPNAEGVYVAGLTEATSNVQQAFQSLVGIIFAGDTLAPLFGVPSGITMKGPINFAGNKLSRVGEPQISTDAATMGFVQNSLNNYVQKTTTINGKPLSSNISLTANDVGALSTAGGTLTGNLTGKYITGTRLQSTADTHSTSKQNSVCVFDGSGWIYSRTLSEFASDLGIQDGVEKYSGTLPTSGWTTSGSQKYYQVSISGMTADKTLLAIPQWSNQTNQQDSWNNLVNIQSYAGYVRFYASAAPNASINYTLIYY